jgi:hypothetical protein
MASTGQFNVVCSGKLTVQLHRTGILGVFRRSIAAECLHFSISGIQVETPAQLKIGESVVMDLVVHDLRVEELAGVVRSASAADDKHYYDIVSAWTATRVRTRCTVFATSTPTFANS